MNESRVDNVEQFASENEDENVVVRVKSPAKINFGAGTTSSILREFLPGSYTVSRAVARQMLWLDRGRVELVSGDVLEPDWSDQKREIAARQLGL